MSNQPLSNEPTTDIAFSPDGKFLATASENWEAKIWDVVAGRQLRSFFCHERVYGVAFNSAQDLLAAACYDGNVILWDVAAGRQHGLPIKHPAPVWEVAFSPDGNLMATAFGNDFTQLQVKLWNIAIDPPSLGLVLPFTVSKDRGALDTLVSRGSCNSA